MDAPSEFKECPAERTVALPGQSVTLTCSSNAIIDICVWIGPTGNNVRPLENHDRYQLVKETDYDCNMRIVSVDWEDNGMWTCQPFVKDLATPSIVSGQLIVAGKIEKRGYVFFKKKSRLYQKFVLGESYSL